MSFAIVNPRPVLADADCLDASANTGLGLTIAKDIIQGHGGRIVLNASYLGGLKVEIILPIRA